MIGKIRKIFNCGCQLDYVVKGGSTFIFNVAVANIPNQIILKENLRLTPGLCYEGYVDPILDNRLLRVNVSQGDFSLRYEAEVEVSYPQIQTGEILATPPAYLPIDTIEYIYPSLYCESHSLFSLASQKFGDLPEGYSQVRGICDWIYENIAYLLGSSDIQTSALDTIAQKTGVCRDFAHLGIALCRAMNIPARFVSGYAYKLIPQDFHAYFEAYLGNQWYIFDPTKKVPIEGLIRIGTGRDASDVSFATIFGDVEFKNMRIWVDCERFIDL